MSVMPIVTYLNLLSSLLLRPPHLVLSWLHSGRHFDVAIGITRGEDVVELLDGGREQLIANATERSYHFSMKRRGRSSRYSRVIE